MAHAAKQYVRLNGELLDTMKARPREFICRMQPEYLSTYWPRLDTATHGWIDWRWDAALLERFVCAFDEPYGGAQTLLKGRTVRLKQAFANREDQTFHPFQSGIVYRANKRWLCIAVEGGSIVVEDLRDEKGDSVLAEVRAGDAFATPPTKLQALRKRVQFDALGRSR